MGPAQAVATRGWLRDVTYTASCAPDAGGTLVPCAHSCGRGGGEEEGEGSLAESEQSPTPFQTLPTGNVVCYPP